MSLTKWADLDHFDLDWKVDPANDNDDNIPLAVDVAPDGATLRNTIVGKFT